MDYTREQLEAMSDLELSQILTVFEAGKPWVEYAELTESGKSFHLADPVGNPYFLDVKDINDWNYIMPLAVKYNITHINSMKLAVHDMRVDSYELIYGIEFKCDKPQRAIACCLILVLQEKL